MVTFGDISDGRRPVYPREYTYQLIFSPVVKSSGAVDFGLWSYWKGAGRPRLCLEVRITISPGVGCFFFLCFGSLLIFVGQRNFPLGFLLMFFLLLQRLECWQYCCQQTIPTNKILPIKVHVSKS